MKIKIIESQLEHIQTSRAAHFGDLTVISGYQSIKMAIHGAYQCPPTPVHLH